MRMRRLFSRNRDKEKDNNARQYTKSYNVEIALQTTTINTTQNSRLMHLRYHL